MLRRNYIYNLKIEQDLLQNKPTCIDCYWFNPSEWSEQLNECVSIRKD